MEFGKENAAYPTGLQENVPNSALYSTVGNHLLVLVPGCNMLSLCKQIFRAPGAWARSANHLAIHEHHQPPSSAEAATLACAERSPWPVKRYRPTSRRSSAISSSRRSATMTARHVASSASSLLPSPSWLPLTGDLEHRGYRIPRPGCVQLHIRHEPARKAARRHPQEQLLAWHARPEDGHRGSVAGSGLLGAV